MTRRPGRSASNDPGLAALLEAKADAICFVAKSWDYHVRVALETTDEENLASIRDSVQRRQGQGPRGAARLRAFLRRLQGQSGIRARLRQGGLRRGRALGGAVRHQWRHAAARGRGDRRRGRARRSPATMSASTPITTPSRRSPIRFAAVRAGARQIQGTLNGLGERCGNANLVSIIPTLKLKPEFAETLRDRRLRRSSSRSWRMSRTRSTSGSTAAQPPRALCRRERLRHQGRHPCLRDRQGPGDLRARRARDRRQQAQGAGVRAGRQVQHAGRARAHRHQGRQGRSAHRPAAGDRQGARGHRLCLRGGRRLVRAAGAAHARHGAELFRRHPVRRQCRAAQQRQGRARHRHAWRWSR